MTKELKGEEMTGLKTLVIDDTNYQTKLTDKFEKRKAWVAPDSRQVFSYLPGTVLSIDVKIGEVVKQNQALMTFEAMKMINTVRAKVAGKVRDINIKIGEKMPKNLLMIELE